MKVQPVMRFGRFLGVPAEMGTPREDQMQGTDMERFAELCGRVCYDSLGKGRSSKEFHAHIKESKHLNVYEGCVLRVRGHLSCDVVGVPYFLQQTFGGLWLLHNQWDDTHGGHFVDFLINARCALETGLFSAFFREYMPAVFEGTRDVYLNERVDYTHLFTKPPQIEPADYTSFWVSCSRCMSHELVRHRWQCHVSQRSTRYVDESDSPIHVHPMVFARGLQTIIDHGIVQTNTPGVWHLRSNDTNRLELQARDLETLAKSMYDSMVKELQDRGVPRKQARGAARFVLPMGLETQLIFGASTTQWNTIIEQRGSEHADAEIREFALAVHNQLGML